jgi:hypothetical protein
MKIILFIAIALVVTIMIVFARTVTRLTRGMRFTEELIYLDDYLKQRPINYQNYLFIRGKFDELRNYRIRSERLDKAWDYFKDKYLEYFVQDSFRKVG